MIKLILGAVIGVMLFTSVAKADEKAITPQEFVNTIAAVPHKVSAHVQSEWEDIKACLLYTSPSPRDGLLSRMPSSA